MDQRCLPMLDNLFFLTKATVTEREINCEGETNKNRQRRNWKVLLFSPFFLNVPVCARVCFFGGICWVVPVITLTRDACHRCILKQSSSRWCASLFSVHRTCTSELHMQTLPLPFSLLTQCQQRNCRGVGSRAYFCYDTYKLSTVALFLLHRNRKGKQEKRNVLNILLLFPFPYWGNKVNWAFFCTFKD